MSRTLHLNFDNVRFWTWWNDGWVKITLKCGERISFSSGGRSEEGYSYDAETYLFTSAEDDIPVVQCTVCSWGRDCDGPHRETRNFLAPVLNIWQAYTPEPPECSPIQWQDMGGEVYDGFAQAMGY